MDPAIVTSVRRIAMAAALLALAVAGVFTLLDWMTNPGGVFRNSAGTAWPIVGETLWSWWWPTFLIAAVVAATLAFIRTLRKRGRG
jgi:hypothetical protein